MIYYFIEGLGDHESETLKKAIKELRSYARLCKNQYDYVPRCRKVILRNEYGENLYKKVQIDAGYVWITKNNTIYHI